MSANNKELANLLPKPNNTVNASNLLSSFKDSAKNDRVHFIITVIKIGVFLLAFVGGIVVMVLGNSKATGSEPKGEFFIDIESAGYTKHLGMFWFLGGGCFAIALFTGWDIFAWLLGYAKNDANSFMLRQVKRYLGFSVADVLISFALMLALNTGSLVAIIYGSLLQGGSLFLAFFILTSARNLSTIAGQVQRTSRNIQSFPEVNMIIFSSMFIVSFLAAPIIFMGIDYHNLTSEYPSTAKTYLLVSFVTHVSTNGIVSLTMFCRALALLDDRGLIESPMYYITWSIAKLGAGFDFVLQNELVDEILGTVMLICKAVIIVWLLFAGPGVDWVSSTPV